MRALNIKNIETTIDISSLHLGRSILCNGYRARSFYIYLMNTHACVKLYGHNDTVSRIRKTCDNLFLTKIPPVIYNGGAWSLGPWGPQSCGAICKGVTKRFPARGVGVL